MVNLPEAQVCSPCIIALGRLLQATSFSNYDDTIASEWASIQKTCQVDYPIDVQPPEATPTDMIGFAPTNYTISTACISGNTYDVASGDDCVRISQSKNVSTGGLIVLNQLFPDCSNLVGMCSTALLFIFPTSSTRNCVLTHIFQSANHSVYPKIAQSTQSNPMTPATRLLAMQTSPTPSSYHGTRPSMDIVQTLSLVRTFVLASQELFGQAQQSQVQLQPKQMYT